MSLEQHPEQRLFTHLQHPLPVIGTHFKFLHKFKLFVNP